MTHLVRVWTVPVDLSPEASERCWDALDDGERASANTFLSARQRRQFTVAHGVLRILVGRELHASPADLTWIPGRHGKPELTPPWSGLHTNVSHSRGMIAVAIGADRPVGVDIQHLLPGLDTVGMSARFFRPDEAEYVGAGPDAVTRADRFAHLWVRKEAIVKAAGGRLWPNLSMPVHGREVVTCADPAGPYRVVDVAAPAGYRAAVALAGSAPFVVETTGWFTETELSTMGI